MAGFWVFMVSIPLCLSVAFASGFPPLSGIISGIIGGMLISFLGGSQITVKGPDLSMTMVVLIAVENLSQYRETGIYYTLAVIVLAGIFQIMLGLAKVGHWYSFIPDAVIYGLVTAIGMLVFAHQVHFLFGGEPLSRNFLQLMLDITNSVIHLNSSVLIVSSICMLILVFPQIINYYFENFPSKLFVCLLVGTGLSYYMGFHLIPESNWTIEAVPVKKEIFLLPDFSKIFIFKSMVYAFTIAFLGTLDSLTNLKNIEVMDFRRKSKPNREIIAIGIGNVIAGLTGGIPIVTSLHKSSTNVNKGAKSYWSTIFKGVFLLSFLLIFFRFFQFIPKAALAAILIFSSYRLNSPRLFNNIRELGIDQLIIFLSTILFTLVFGILAGLLGGLITAFIIYIVLGSSLKSMFLPKIEITSKGKKKVKIDIYGAALASNYLQIKGHLSKLSDKERLIIDLSNTKVVDNCFLEHIYYFARLNNLDDGRMEIQGLKYHVPLSRHPLSTLRIVKSGKKRKLTSHLTERQIDIQAVASVNNARLETNLTYDGIVLQGFSFAFGYEIRYRENKFMKFYKSSTIEFSDVFLSKGIRMSEQSYKISVFLITVMDMPLPDFSLSKEDIVDKMFQSLGFEDIDFEGYPVFSELYKLTGENKQAIIQFFNPQLIEFFEKNQGYCLEAQNNRILLYKDKDLIHKTDLEDAINFTENMLDIMHNQKEVVTNDL